MATKKSPAKKWTEEEVADLKELCSSFKAENAKGVEGPDFHKVHSEMKERGHRRTEGGYKARYSKLLKDNEA